MGFELMDSSEVRGKFLDYFKRKGHAVIPSASLLPENDPSVLFTTAGMHPLVPYLKGESHPLGKRLTDVQKCIRTTDIENIGDDGHLTFFEMLGYWSLGDYFKKESIEYTFGFYSEVLRFNKDDISVTVFEGDDVAPFDSEAYDAWKDVVGIPEERIYKYGKGENWWGLASGVGPCGPCTEMFIDTGKPKCSPDCGPSCNCGKFVEIGNNVFIEFDRKEDGSIEKLAQHNVDVGLGLERLTMFSQEKTNVYETDLFVPIMAKIKGLATKEDERSSRIIADHIRAATFAICDGAIPSNTGAGYIVRRLIRRSLVAAKKLGIEKSEGFCASIAEAVIAKMGGPYGIYPELTKKQLTILEELHKEEGKFRKTLELGLKEFDRIAGSGGSAINGEDAFLLFQSYGFPIEITQELAAERGIKIDLVGFDAEFQKHKELSQTANAGVFKGGLAESNEVTTRYHTATHLLLAAIREVLGPDIYQKGSNITSERVRFDFNYPDKVSEENLKKIEDIVNLKIAEAIPVEMMEMPKEDALANVKVSFDASKYPDIVKVYKIGSFSSEVCGGPHVGNISELGHFRILKEESSSAGVRRIKAVLE